VAFVDMHGHMVCGMFLSFFILRIKKYFVQLKVKPMRIERGREDGK
jgi:hypothetical protein